MVAQEEALSVVQPAGGLAAGAMNVESLLMRAVESGVPVESLERLMAMRRELVAEQARTAFFAALAGFQAECPVIPKTGEVKERGGQQVRYRFAPLDKIVSTIRPHLERFGLSYTFNAVFDIENHHLIAVCEVHHALGHTEASEFRVPISKDNFMNGAQHFGSASSYARRYALCNALGLLTGDEDDDAQAAPPPVVKRQQAATGAHPTPPHAEAAPAEHAHPSPESDREREQRQKRAAGLVARGLVRREGNGFQVSNGAIQNPQTYEVGRDAAGKVYCTCDEFKAAYSGFRCEHILAAKQFVEQPEPTEEDRESAAKLRERIYREFAHMKFSAEDIAAYMQKNEKLHGGTVLEVMSLEQLAVVASGMEIK